MFQASRSSSRRRRRSRNRRVTPTLDVSARARKAPRTDWKRVAPLILVPLAALVVLGGLFLGVRAIGAALFSRNQTYVIRNLVVDTDDPVARDYFEVKRGIRKGGNLFAFDIADVREEFLRLAPNYRSIAITRTLPDTIAISVTPRDPVALIGRRGSFAADADGHVFGHRARNSLPLILGYDGPVLRPGDRLSGLAADAVLLIDAWNTIDLDRELVVVSVDASGGFGGAKDALEVSVVGGLRVAIRWDKSRGRVAAAEDLRNRIRFLHALVAREKHQNRRLGAVDLTQDDYQQHTVATTM